MCIAENNASQMGVRKLISRESQIKKKKLLLFLYFQIVSKNIIWNLETRYYMKFLYTFETKSIGEILHLDLSKSTAFNQY